MATIDERECKANFPMTPTSYTAKCRVQMATGEVFMNVYVRIFPVNNPDTFTDTNMGSPDSNGRFVCSWATAPPSTTGPYRYFMHLQKSEFQDSSPGDVT